jgi:serine O-acetyltransferase
MPHALMWRTLKLIHTDLKAKAQANYGGDGAADLLRAVASDGTPATVLYRLMQGAHRAHLTPFDTVFQKLNATLCHCTIGRGADFGPGFVIFHSDGVVINTAVRGGSNVFINHQVTVGDDGRHQVPNLGDNVYIGAGAKVLGAIEVGSGARIGANAVVVKDVEADSTVVGIPAKPVTRKNGDGPAFPHER